MAALVLIRRIAFRVSLAAVLLLPTVSCFAIEAADLYEKRSPSIWLVSVHDAQGQRIKMGSAVVTGHEELVTNCHVLTQGRSITIKHENTAHAAQLAHADVERDLCIIRAKGLAAPAVKIAPVSTLKVGQKVYAIGAPRGMELTLSDGLLSALNHDKDDNLTRIQISAPISPGSSGGGVFDTDGRLIGIAYLTLKDAQNLNFAIPADWIAQVPARAKVALEKFRAENPPQPAKLAKAPEPTGGQPGLSVPYLGEKGQERFRDFLTRPFPRAFAISDTGYSVATWGSRPKDPTRPVDTKERALQICKEAAGKDCMLYMVDSDIVFSR
ncbi:S1C family serine protease [Cupriavidus lacunae]|uniref:Serine protease n=1 Tax=Cupriavidus lacunae TaxID=2666307 RepID=A0A370NNZ2_9BURK|nr:serine protease [Cupriavidus lacunae]RDK07335.1 serine protease [Cupriavidus lacunae]